MKIIYFVNELVNKGGIGRILTDKMNYLADKCGYDITCCVLNNDTESFYKVSPNVHLTTLGINAYGGGSVMDKAKRVLMIRNKVSDMLIGGGIILR